MSSISDRPEIRSGSEAGTALRLKLATSAAGIGIWEWRLGTNEMIYDDQARAICGLDSGPLDIDDIRAITHPDDLPLTAAQARRALDPAVRDTSRYRYRITPRNSDEIRWVDAHGEAIFEETTEGLRAIAYVGTLQDVTEDVLREQKLEQSEERLRLALSAGDLAIWEIDLRTGTVTPSPALNRICGFAPDATPTLEEYRSRYAPGERERLEKLGSAALASGSNKLSVEVEFCWPDGTRRWGLLNVQVAAGHKPGEKIIGTLLDITDRKLKEQRLDLVAREMRHRVKNTLTVVNSVIAQTLKGKSDITEVRALLEGRIRALSAANDTLFASDFNSIDLGELLQRVLRAFTPEDREVFRFEGGPVELPASTTATLGLVIHEFATNAMKYGALSVPEGRVEVTWQPSAEGVQLIWREQNGPKVTTPVAPGFGTRLFGLLTNSMHASHRVTYEETGVIHELDLPL